jgi:hypothetical protein
MRAKSRGEHDYTTGRAARELRVSPNHVRALCQAGMVAARATRGGHWRIPQSEMQRLRRDGVPDPPPATPSESQAEIATVSAANPPHRHPALLAEPSKDAIASADEVVRLENEVRAIGLKRSKEENLDWFRDRHRNQAEANAARVQRNLQAKGQRLRREWDNAWLEYALECVPDDAPEGARLSVAGSVREVLAGFSPSDPEEVVEPLIRAAVERALRPWRRTKEIETAIQDARNQLPGWVKSWSNELPTDWELRAIRAARDAIGQLRNDAMFQEMRAAATAAGREVARQCEDCERRRTIVESVFLRTPRELENARRAVKAALDSLTVGTSQREMEKARDIALAPFQAAEEAARVQAQATSQADLYLLHVDSYLAKIGADPDSEWDLGNSSDRGQLAQELKTEIRPILIQAILEEPLNLDEAYTFIESLVDRRF